MLFFLYNVFIYPLVQILDLFYLFFFRIFSNHGISIISVSLAISLFTLPFYLEAEKWQLLERNIKIKLDPKINKIKSVFHGDERFMVLSAFYKQNNYHPVFSLRSSIGILMQIPFFIAAFSYLSNLDALLGTPFMWISNLGAPDSLLKIQIKQELIYNFNILPILMTVINISASLFYLKGLDAPTNGLHREKIQFFGMALVFLLLLYNSPSGIVLYWTFNNIFSLIKNTLIRKKYSHLIIYLASCFGALLLAIFVLIFHHGALFKRIIIAFVCLLVFCFPLLLKLYKYLAKLLHLITDKSNSAIKQKSTIFMSSAIMFFLTGIVIPSTLVYSSVEDFSFIEHYSSPLPFILLTAAQAFGFFVFWIIGIYFLFSNNKKHFITALITVLSVWSLINVFIFSSNYGILTVELIFSARNILWPSISSIFLNIIFLAAACGVTVFFLLCKRKIILQSLQIIVLISLFAAGTFNIIAIFTNFRSISNQKMEDQFLFSAYTDYKIKEEIDYTPIFEFSKNGKNLLIIMLDRAIPGFVPQILLERPELNIQFSGFVFYPNTISFGSHTLFGLPALLGGYEYSPLEINSRLNETLVSKYNEAVLLLPKIFLENNFKVTVTDPPLHEENIQNLFAPYPGIKAARIMNLYTEDWLKRNPDVQLTSVSQILENRLIYFSFFKCAPLFFRHYIYDDGRWLAAKHGNTPLKTIESYSMLDLLPEITSFIDTETNTFTVMVNNLTHEQAFLQAPDYTIPSISSTNKGSGPYALDYNYHINIAAFLLLGKWFSYLKENGVYNNTRIIIVSDHGINDYSNFENNIILPTKECLQFYTALLFFKDFNSEGDIFTDNQFMTNADTPILVIKDILNNPVNPFTGKILEENKEEGVTITSSQNFNKAQYNNRYNISPVDWLHVKDSIFDPNNWKKVRIN